MKPTFDEWFAARNGGASFERVYMGPSTQIHTGMKALTREIRDYVSEMAGAGMPEPRPGDSVPD